MLYDVNNREIRTGDTVQISGAYFKSSNGLFFVESIHQDGTAWLRRIKKNGELTVGSAKSSESWPLRSYCSDSRKNAEARRHNAESARIEIVDDVNTWYIVELFRSYADSYRERAQDIASRCGADRDDVRGLLETAKEQQAAAERLAGRAKQPEEKEPEKGVKFYWNGIKVDGGRLIPCYYSLDENSVTITAKDYKDLPREYFVVKNDTDLYSDYFDSDRTTLTPEHPLYRFARYAAFKGIMGGRTYRTPTDEQRAEWERTKDPGQPMQKDLYAVEELKAAQESARLAAEHAAQLAEREKRLRKISEGRQYIEQTAAEHPITDGAPTVEIGFSESPYLYSLSHGANNIFSVAAAEIILKHYDEQAHAEQRGYDKTDFIVRWTDEKTGEEQIYEGRYDLGDNDGGLIEHIRAFGRSTLHDEEQNAEIRQLADHLEQYTTGGRVVKVEAAPWVIDFAEEKRKREQQAAEQMRADLMDQVAMLTDEQVEAAVYCVDPKDKEKLDVARFFLQELARRDEQRALEVFRKWSAGA